MKFTYKGHEAVKSMVESRLQDMGHVAVDAVDQAEVVLTYCTSQTKLEDLYFDAEGVVKSAAKGTLLIDMSPTTPAFARELAAIAMVSDLLVVEAPLIVVDPSAENAFAERDNVTCFASGEDEAKEKAKDVLAVLFCGVRDMGDSGAASMAMGAYTIQSVAAMIAAVEADSLYRSVRMMPAGLGQAAAGRPGALSPACDALLDAVEAGRFGGAFTLEMLMAQVAAVIATAEEAEAALPLTDNMMQLIEALAIIGGGHLQPSALALAYRDQDAVAKEGLDWGKLGQLTQNDSGMDFDLRDGAGSLGNTGDPDDYDLDDDDEDESPFRTKQDDYDFQQTHEDYVDYGFEDDDPGYDFGAERTEEYADFEDEDFD